jgi:xylulose-5-phosphate/fructose-6-phosphate phosphoketolase
MTNQSTAGTPATLSRQEITGIDAYWRAANDLTVGQIYLLQSSFAGAVAA